MPPPGELIEVREGTDVGLLQDVLGFGVVTQDGTRRAVEALVVTAHDDLEERRLAAAHARHDLLVGEPADPRWYDDLRSLIHRGPTQWSGLHGKGSREPTAPSTLYWMGGNP